MLWLIIGTPMLSGAQPNSQVPSPKAEAAVETIRDIENNVEKAIESGDTTFLQSVFSDDFRFIHFSGEITNKNDSLKQVSEKPYTMRRLDGVQIEMHGDVVITYGLVDINARGEGVNHSYLVKYVRIYRNRGGHWQMIMQQSVDETSSIAFDLFPKH